MALAKNVRGLIHTLGPESVPMILPIIYTLFASEDNKVREAMMTAFEGICKDNGLRDKELIKICRKLADDLRWTSQISAAMVLCRLCRNIGQIKASETMSILSELSHKEDPPVRAAVAYNLKVCPGCHPVHHESLALNCTRRIGDPCKTVERSDGFSASFLP